MVQPTVPQDRLANLAGIDRESRRRDLEHRIAIQAARSDIESFCVHYGDTHAGGHWWHTARVSPADCAELVARAHEYLALCGLLEPLHPSSPIVRIKLECLPT